MKIAYTTAPGRGDTDLLLQRVASLLIARGYRPAGTAQVNSESPCDGPCDMDVVVLPDGPMIRISQSLGKGARGCRLDPAALETAVGLVQASLPVSDCLIVNKFGKHEATGRGFVSVIGDALSLGLPVLVGLNQLNAAAFEEYAAGCATQLDAVDSALERWLLDNIARNPRTSRTQDSPVHTVNTANGVSGPPIPTSDDLPPAV